jgi:hypothetical protein
MKTILTSLVVLAVLLSHHNARAGQSPAVDSVTVTAKVKAFDETSVIVENEKELIKVPRSMVKQKTLTRGEAVSITFKGKEELRLLQSTDRQPASKPLPTIRGR